MQAFFLKNLNQQPLKPLYWGDLIPKEFNMKILSLTTERDQVEKKYLNPIKKHLF